MSLSMKLGRQDRAKGNDWLRQVKEVVVLKPSDEEMAEYHRLMGLLQELRDSELFWDESYGGCYVMTPPSKETVVYAETEEEWVLRIFDRLARGEDPGSSLEAVSMQEMRLLQEGIEAIEKALQEEENA